MCVYEDEIKLVREVLFVYAYKYVYVAHLVHEYVRVCVC